jgi:hypothetical protein
METVRSSELGPSSTSTSTMTIASPSPSPSTSTSVNPGTGDVEPRGMEHAEHCRAEIPDREKRRSATGLAW